MLLELAIGDAYGAGFEYADPDFVAAHNTLLGYVQHPRHRGILPGAYTDDTQLTIAVAEALLSGEPWSAATLADRFVEAFRRDPRDGYAPSFGQLLSEMRDGEELLARLRPDSNKSGAAMRASPVGLLPDVPEILHRTAVQARITHDTPSGIESAQAAALAVHYCHHDLGPLAEIGRWIEHTLPPGVGGWARPWHGKVGSRGRMSVRAALTVVSRGGSLSEMLRACVAFTGDVDTVATIALAAASRSGQVVKDLPAVLVDTLEDGPYGLAFLRGLDARLLTSGSGAAPRRSASAPPV